MEAQRPRMKSGVKYTVTKKARHPGVDHPIEVQGYVVKDWYGDF